MFGPNSANRRSVFLYLRYYYLDMPFFELFDETLDINATGNYSLLMRIGREELAFAIMDNLRAKYILLRSFEPESGHRFSYEEIKNILLEDEFLERRYKHVRIGVSSSKYSLVPAPIMDPGKKEQLFGLSHKTGENEVILANRLDDPDAFLLFAVDGEIANLAETLVPGQPPVHFVKPFVSNVLFYSKKKSVDSVYLFVGKDFVTISAVSNETLRFCNSYGYRSPNDILYFLLKVYKTLGISNEIPLYCSGCASKNGELYPLLSGYIKTVMFIGPAGNFSFSYVFNEEILHRYINLFSLINCG